MNFQFILFSAAFALCLNLLLVRVDLKKSVRILCSSCPEFFGCSNGVLKQSQSLTVNPIQTQGKPGLLHREGVPPSKFDADDDPRTLNVHVVPHTHDDVGWLKTVDQYFYGENMTIQHACVQDILDSVITSLTENAARTFTYVEIKFFSMWWDLQDDAMKDTVRYLVANQQLSFANGGWCMHDEAATHFIGMIDQTTLGHSFLKKELGVIPRVGWQLDPFGHSSSQASYFTSKVGFDALFFGRIDYQDLNKRHLEQECEGLWNSSKNFESTVFWGLTGSYSGNYGPPDGFCFDVFCDDPYIIDMNDKELQAAIRDLLGKIRLQSDRTKGSHIMLTMGEDFNYQRAHVNFANTDLMISSILEMQRLNKFDTRTMFGPRFDQVKIFYSSPEYYTKEKFRESQRTAIKQGKKAKDNYTTSFKVKEDDFMPYSDCENCFWTGYFTSRTGIKRLERVASSFLLASRQIESFFNHSWDGDKFRCTHSFHQLEDASGVAQHHDGVSGTSKQHVANDYAKRLQNGMNRVSACTTRKIRQILFSANASDFFQDLTYCQMLNETNCMVSQAATAVDDRDVYIVVYNALVQNRDSVVHLPVSKAGMYTVEQIGEYNSTILVGTIPETMIVGKNSAKYRLPFLAEKIPPLGANVYRVSRDEHIQFSSSTSATRQIQRVEKRRDFTAANKYYTAVIERESGHVLNIRVQNKTIDFNQLWGYYTSYDNKHDAPPDNHEKDPNSKNNQNSGAYIFRPSTPGQTPVFFNQTSARFYKTCVGLEVHAEFEVPWIKTVTRILKSQPFLEVEYTIGPIPVDDGRGKEIVTVFNTSINNNGRFHTDSNGREFVERRINHRPTWDLNVYQPIAGNFYPVNAAMYIEDKDGSALAVSNDRSQGGSSIIDGSLEFMVQRRTLTDDWRGVNEAMNETTDGMTPYPPYGNARRMGDGVVIRGKHRIRLGEHGGATLARSMMDEMFVDPLVFVASASSGKREIALNPFNGMASSAPQNVMLITRKFESDGRDTILLRLGHQYGIGEDPLLSQPVQVRLRDFVPEYIILNITETTLSANQEFDTWKASKINWKDSINNSSVPDLRSNNYSITIKPMDIRTFRLQIKER